MLLFALFRRKDDQQGGRTHRTPACKANGTGQNPGGEGGIVGGCRVRAGLHAELLKELLGKLPVPILFRSIESGPCPFGRGFTHRAVHGEMHRIDVQNGGFGGILINVGKHQTLIFQRCKIFTVRGIDLAINSERDFRKTQQKISNNIENSLQMIA